MQRSIATVSISGTLELKLRAIAQAGFNGVEIFENDLLYFDGSPRDVKQIAADLGLSILLFQPFRDFEAAPRLCPSLALWTMCGSYAIISYVYCFIG